MENRSEFDVDIQELKICTFNVNGLKDEIKQDAILKLLRDLKFEVIALQETHLEKADFDTFRSKWHGPIIFKEGTSHSKGSCILFNSYFKEEQLELLLMNDRVLLCSYKLGKEILYFCNIYAPNDSAGKIRFFYNLKNQLSPHIENIALKKLIIMGDFNCVLNNKLDIVTGKPHPVDTVKAFNVCVEDLELIDLWRKNNRNTKDYTFSRIVARRLDFIFSSKLLLPYITECNILSSGHSDHRMVVCKVEFNHFKRGKGTYKMNSSLFENVQFRDSVKKLINESKEEFANFDPLLKWEAIKIRVKEHTQLFGKYNNFKKKEETNNLRLRLSTLESEWASDVNNFDKQKEIFSIKKQLEIRNIELATAARIRSKIQWIEEGEKCSKFFLALEKHHGVSSTVFKIKDKFGNVQTEGNKIVAVFADHFRHVYENNIEEETISKNFDDFLNNVTLKSLDDFEKNELDKEINETELLNALKSMNKNASPGLDGFCIEFYFIYFEEIKDILLDFYNTCYDQRALTKNSQLGLITLIHKGKGLERNEVNNWRPITMSNIDYKIIAKLLANRLKKVISKLVGQQQQGFIKGRNIANIIRSIDDIIEYEKNAKLKDFLFIIDFKQAFDKINTEYICQVFKKFGFGDYFLNWLTTIFANRHSCVKNGGHLSDFFPVFTGVKQGCPIAPLLFVLAAEILAQNIIQDSKIKGVKYPCSLSDIKILQFADDTSFLCKDKIDIKEILSRLKLFSLFSGLIINIKKCSIMPMGIGRAIIDNSLEGVAMTDEVKIVGIIFRKDKSASEIEDNWNNKIDKIKGIIKNWMKRKLTVIGKIQVIKTFILSQFVYLLQSLALPYRVLDEINSILYRFIWRKDHVEKRAWERLKRKVLSNDKENGGLNMINIHDFQNSFLLHWGKRLLSKDLEDWKLIPMYVFKCVGGLFVFKSKVSSKDFKGSEHIKSLFWKNVLQSWLDNNTFTDEITLNDVINNNKFVTVHGNPLFVFEAVKNNIITVKDMLNEAGEIISFAEYNNRIGRTASNLIDHTILKTAISKIQNRIQHLQTNQAVFFKDTNIESLDRKKIYELLLKYEKCHCETIWEKKLGKKINDDTWTNIFLCTKETKLQEFQWKIVHNIFPTNILLNRMGLEPSEKCETCGVAEFVEHLFYECQRLGNFWEKIENIIRSKVNKNVSITKNIAILGIEQLENYKTYTEKEIYEINNILIIAKFSIYKSKSKDLQIDTVFEREMEIRNNRKNLIY